MLQYTPKTQKMDIMYYQIIKEKDNKCKDKK